MRWLEWLRGTSHPSASWQRDQGLNVHLNLDVHGVCGGGIGDPIESLSRLGPPEDSRAVREQRYCFYSMGFEVGADDDRIADFTVFWVDYLQQGFKPFTGSVTWKGREIALNALTSQDECQRRFGSPFWSDADEDETILFYEFRHDIEWQVEFTPQRQLKALRVVWPPLLAESDYRERLRVNRSWPPHYDD